MPCGLRPARCPEVSDVNYNSRSTTIRIPGFCFLLPLLSGSCFEGLVLGSWLLCGASFYLLLNILSSSPFVLRLRDQCSNEANISSALLPEGAELLLIKRCGASFSAPSGRSAERPAYYPLIPVSTVPGRHRRENEARAQKSPPGAFSQAIHTFSMRVHGFGPFSELGPFFPLFFFDCSNR